MIFRAALGSAISVSALVFLCTPTPSRGQPVPAEAPDSVPATIFEDAHFVEESSGDLVSTTILSVSFDVAASHAEKEAAIRAVSGTVIGGAAGDVEGIYLVRVQGDGTIATIDSIAAELRSRPGVVAAFKFSWWQPGTMFGISKRPSQVPPVPPDTVPASFDEDAAFVSDGSMSQVSTTILAVHFANGATLAEKQQAVDLIAGRVIGGVAVGEEGLYYIQVEGDGTIATIDSIAAVLRALPTIASAYPERVLPIGR